MLILISTSYFMWKNNLIPILEFIEQIDYICEFPLGTNFAFWEDFRVLST